MTAGKEIPSWAQGKISLADLKNVETAIAEIESKTQGEIVPMIIPRTVLPQSIQLFFFFSLAFLEIFQLLLPMVDDLPDGVEWMGLCGSLILGLLTSRSQRVQNMMYSSHMVRMIMERAELEFYRAKMDRTDKHVGILLFLSLAERRAVVLADKGIAEKLQPEEWLAVVRLMTRAAKSGKLGDGICEAIRECGNVLATHFPSEQKRQNEISNRLLFRNQ